MKYDEESNRSKTSQPDGLSTVTACHRLTEELEQVVKDQSVADARSWPRLIRDALAHSPGSVGLPCCAIFFLVEVACVLGIGTVVASGNAKSLSHRQVIRAASTVLILVILMSGSLILQAWLVWLKRSEVARKAKAVILKLHADASGLVAGGGQTYPELYAPASECVALQWTYRDGALVNLPCMLLVRGDVILLRPGRHVHCACESLGLRRVGFTNGDIYLPEPTSLAHGQGGHGQYAGVGTVGGPSVIGGRGMVQPQPLLLCRVTETPATCYFRSCLKASSGSGDKKHRPTTVFQAECQAVLHHWLERRVIPAVLVVSVALCLCRGLISPTWSGTWVEMLLLLPCVGVLPVAGFACPLFYFTTHVVSLYRFVTSVDSVHAAVMAVTKMSQRNNSEFVNADVEDPKAQLSHESQLAFYNFARHTNDHSKTPGPPGDFLTRFRLLAQLTTGDPWLLPMTGNVIQNFGNITGVDVLDKKGVLSHPNPVAEKVLFFRRNPYVDEGSSRFPRAHEDSGSGNMLDMDAIPGTDRTYTTASGYAYHGANGAYGAKMSKTSMTSNQNNTVILDLTPARNAGLMSGTFDSFGGATDSHFRVHFDDPAWGQYIANLKPLGLNLLLNSCHLQQPYAHFLDHLHYVSHYVPRTIAVVNRRCLCSLSEAMGFDLDTARQHFQPLNTLCTYRRRPGDPPLPGLQKHRTPLANLFTALVYDKLTQHVQTFSQGTVDLVAESCAYYWDGNDVQRLTRQCRKRLDDFYNRYSMTAYCTAFSYSPFVYGIDGGRSSQAAVAAHFGPADTDAWSGGGGKNWDIGGVGGRGGFLEWPKDDRVFDPDSVSIHNRRRVTRRRCGALDHRHNSRCRHYPLSLSAESLTVQVMGRKRPQQSSANSNHDDPDMTPRTKAAKLGVDPPPSSEQVLEACLARNIFLGMVSLQYQAKPDVVTLVEQLDRACIRFVYFSRENELRSRVFAEKMGLEAGWNCHISLSSEGSQTTIAPSEAATSAVHIASGGGGDGLIFDASRKAKSFTILSKSPNLSFQSGAVSQTPQTNGRHGAVAITDDVLGGETEVDNGEEAGAGKASQDLQPQTRTRTMTLPKDTKFALPSVHFRSQPETPIEIDEDEPEPGALCGPNMDPNAAVDALALKDEESQEEDEDRSLPENSPLLPTSHQHTRIGSPTSPVDRKRTDLGLSGAPTGLTSCSSATSRSSLQSASSSGGAGGMSMPGNRAKLPKGIENVRPHLANVDNVPLLVSLFTDCSPYSVMEMVRIMQEYGELVAVVGSLLNPENVDAFCTANVAVGIQPTLPLICAHGTGYSRPEFPTGPTQDDDNGVKGSKRIDRGQRSPTSPSKGQVVNGRKNGISFSNDTLPGTVHRESRNGSEEKAHYGDNGMAKGGWTFSPPSGQVAAASSSPGVVDLACLIQSLPTSLQLSCGSLQDIVPIISLARHLLSSIRGALLYLHSCLLALSMMHILCMLLPVPPLFTPDQMVFEAVILLPIQAFSLTLAPLPSTGDGKLKLDVSVTKNDQPVSRRAVRGFVLAFLVKFLPTILVTVLLFCLCYLSPCVTNTRDGPSDAHCELFGNFPSNASMEQNVPFSWGRLVPDGSHDHHMYAHLTVCQQAATFFLLLSFLFLSSGYVYYRWNVQERRRWHSRAWLGSTLLVLLLKLLCMTISLSGLGRGVSFWTGVPVYVWVLGLVWPPIAAGIAELYKRTEITAYNRMQRRRRISFNTKLGMNSPF